MEPEITWYAQAAFRVDVGGLHIYLDPYHLPDGEPPADLLLVSHEHGDHFSPEDIARVRQAGTVVVASSGPATRLDGPVTTIEPGQAFTHSNVSVRAVPAYNVDKFRSPGVPFHPREQRHVGFVFEVDDLSFYFAGDTDLIPEMDDIGPVDYAFLPVSGRTVMTAEEAAEAARILRPSVAIPMHYGGAMGTLEDARRFAELVPDQVRVWILDPRGPR